MPTRAASAVAARRLPSAWRLLDAGGNPCDEWRLGPGGAPETADRPTAMATEFKVQIVSPEGLLFDAAADAVELPTTSGEIGVLPGHTQLVTELGVGELRVVRGRQVEAFAVAGGFAEVEPQLVRVLATFVDAGADETGMEAAIARAKTALESAEGTTPERLEHDIAALRTQLAKGRLRRPVGTR